MNFAWLLVGGVYALAIAVTRRAGIELPRRIAIAFYLLTLLFLWQPLTQRVVNAPMNVLQFVPPWTSLAPPGLTRATASNYELQDVVMQMIPWAHQVRESWGAGHVPLWNELSGTGYPLLGNAQSAALSPLRLLALPLPLAYSMAAEAAMKILAGLTFTFLYCRRRYDLLPSMAGAVAFGFGTFLIVWLHFPHATVAAFLPAVLYQIDLLAERQTYDRFVFAAFLGPLVLFGGHPETTAHIVLFAALYAGWIAAVERPPGTLRFLGGLAGAAAVAALLASPFLVPVAEGVRQSARYLELAARPHSGIAFSDWPSLSLLFQPRLFGTLPGPVWSTAAAAESICGFAGILGISAWFGLLARAIARRELRTREMFCIVASLLIFLMLDDFAPLSYPLHRFLPLALHSRLRLPFSFLAAVQAAALLHYAGRKWLLVGVVFGAAVLAFTIVRTPFPSEVTRNAALLAMVPSVAVLVLAALRIRMAVIAAIFVELWLVGHHWNPVRPLSEFYPRTPVINALLRQDRTGWRTASIGGTLFPNTNAIFGVDVAGVHDPMANGRYVELLQRETQGFDTRAYYAKWRDAETPLLDEVGARWVLAEAGVDLPDRQRYRLVYDGPDGRLYENRHARRRFFGDGAEIAIINPYELRVSASHPTLISSSIAWWKGWRVTYNGRSIEPQRIHGTFLGFTVPAGRGTVTARYAPTTFYASAAASSATALALLVIAVYRRRAMPHAGAPLS
jgi:hypothetical protein